MEILALKHPHSPLREKLVQSPPLAKKVRWDPGPESVFFVPHTPHGVLRKEIQEAENLVNAGNKVTKVKVVERNGMKIADQLCNRTPWRNEECNNQECIPCIYKPGSCRKRNCVQGSLCDMCSKRHISCLLGGIP